MDIKNVLTEPCRVFCVLASRGVFKWMPDKMYLQLYYCGKIKKS